MNGLKSKQEDLELHSGLCRKWRELRAGVMCECFEVSDRTDCIENSLALNALLMS